MDLGGFPGFQGSGVFRPLPSVAIRWHPLADLCRPLADLWHQSAPPLKKVYGALEAWILDAWRLGGLEAWRLAALAEAGGLEARGFEAGQVF